MPVFGLILSDPSRDLSARGRIRALLDMQTIPFEGFAELPSPMQTGLTLPVFLRQAAPLLMKPGTPLPMAEVLCHLSGRDAMPGNVLRRYVCLQWSLMPYLRMQRTVRDTDGGFLLGSDLLIMPPREDGTLDAALPGGVWTDLTDGSCWSGPRLRLMRGYNAMPVLVRPGALLPVSVEDRGAAADEADRLTLHWFQPDAPAEVVLSCGIRYRAELRDGQPHLATETDKPCHLIVHRDGVESLIL